MVAKVFSTSLLGVMAMEVSVESQIISALKRFAVVGLPDGVLREAKERVRCAIEHSGFRFPRAEVVVSLAPAALPKTGSAFDLPIALSILAAAGAVDRARLSEFLVLGELALDGEVKSIPGVLAAAQLARSRERPSLLVPRSCASQCSLIRDIAAFGVGSLLDAVAFLNNALTLEPVGADSSDENAVADLPTFGDVVGQHAAKRALEISAAGGHNVLFIGPPGTGKTMLASRVRSLLPPLGESELLEVATIATSYGRSPAVRHRIPRHRPFRAPHHTTSTAGLIGGGTVPQAGEVTLAHRGVLFLDELPEFRRESLEALRQPLEQRKVFVTRANFTAEFPADFILISAMNPCPCGRQLNCQCSHLQMQRYRHRLSGPLLDRIDLHIGVPQVEVSDLTALPAERDPTAEIRARVSFARHRQRDRFGRSAQLNTHLTVKGIRQWCGVSPAAEKLLGDAAERLHLSMRSYHRVLKVARTIADLAGRVEIAEEDVAEAIGYRSAFEG